MKILVTEIDAMSAGNIHINILYDPQKNDWEIRTIRKDMSNPSYSLIIFRFPIVNHIRNKSNLKPKIYEQ